MPLQDVLQALSRTPVTQPQLRAALATTCARWHLVKGEEADAIRHLGHALEMVPDLRPAMRLLYRIYLDRGDIRSAVMYLDQEIRATRHPREAAALYRERGQLVEAHFHDLSAAQQCYQAALKATPRDLAVLRSVERVSLARGDVFWLIANLETQLEVLQHPAAVAGVLHDLALLEARHKGDLGLAGDLLIASLELAPGHLLLASDMFRLAEVAGDAELMLRALEVEAETRGEQRRALPLARASVTLREHRERGAALALLTAAARSAPHNFSLWRSLEELSMATSRFDIALQAVIGQLQAAGEEEEPTARAELFYRMGKLALFRLDRPVDGLAAMRKAMRLAPGHPLVMEDTGRFLNANSMWSQLLELIKLEIVCAREAGFTSEEVALANLRAGQLMEERLQEPEGARRCYEDAIAADANYRPPRDRLERILHQLGDTEGLRRHYAAELELAKTAQRRGFLLSVLAQLHSEDEDPAEPIRLLTELLKEQSDHLPSLQLLARLLAKAGRHGELLSVTEQEVGLTTSAARRAKLQHRAGELALQQEEPDLARDFFTKALESVDDHLPSLESLGDLLRTQEDWPALVELLRKELLYANDRARQVAIQLEIATILSTKLDREEDALDELQALLQRWPRHLPALHAAESLAAALGRDEALLDLLEQHIATVTGPRTRALLLHRVSGIRSRLGDDEGAVRDLVRALELWPQLGVARARLLHLYEQLGRSRQLQAFAEAGLTSERGADDRRAMALQLAELSPKPVVAIQYLGAVAEARPEDYVTQLRLAQACHQAGRSSREAGALRAVADAFAEQVSEQDSSVTAMRYLSARAEEGAGNLDAADQAYAQILDMDPEHLLAQRGRHRIRDRKREAALARSSADLETSIAETSVAHEKAAYLVIAAEMMERRLDLRGALSKANAALSASPKFLPALHARARILERLGDDAEIAEAVQTLRRLAKTLTSAPHAATALCRAGTLALRAHPPGKPNPLAWELFTEALRLDPECGRAIRGLRRTRDAHGTEGASRIGILLLARLDAMRENDSLSAHGLRELVHLGADVDGPDCAVALLERGMDVAPTDAGLHADLAQAYARLGQWSQVVGALDTALAREMSPERRSALQFFAGEANERAGRQRDAVTHYLEAGRMGFHPVRSLINADRLAGEVGALEKRVEALQGLVDVGDGPQRVAALRQLADLHRGALGQPDVAVDLMRELLLLRPTDLDVLTELRRLLDTLERGEEATAALLAGIAHHRAWLRSNGGDEIESINPAPIAGLLRLFDAMGDADGVYVAACVLQILAEDLLPSGRHPDELITDPWPMPKPQEGRPFEGLVGDLPCSAAFDLLREGVFFLGDLPLVEADAEELSPSRSLPPGNAVVQVVRALSNAMSVPQPLCFLSNKDDESIAAHIGPVPALVVGRRAAATPADPASRAAYGRALLRLSTGGDRLHVGASPAQLLAILVALCNGVGVEFEIEQDFDWKFAAAVGDTLPPADALGDLHDAALAFRNTLSGFDPKTFKQTLLMAEDRAGAVCAADPRSSLYRIAGTGPESLVRLRVLTGYLLSDDHLTLRRTLGYHAEIRTRRSQEMRG